MNVCTSGQTVQLKASISESGWSAKEWRSLGLNIRDDNTAVRNVPPTAPG